VLFDLAIGAETDRIRLSKDGGNNLNLTIYDTNGGMKQWTAAAIFVREMWTHIGFSYTGGAASLYVNGQSQSTSIAGSGTGQITNVAPSFFVGTDYTGSTGAGGGGAVFDDLVIASGQLQGNEFSRIGIDIGPYLGLASARKGFDAASGSGTTDPMAGNQTTIAHGLGTTPAFVEITETTNGIVYLSAPADGNNLYVKGSASSVGFNWRALA